MKALLMDSIIFCFEQSSEVAMHQNIMMDCELQLICHRTTVSLHVSVTPALLTLTSNQAPN